jgi:hypothetical protein
MGWEKRKRAGKKKPSHDMKILGKYWGKKRSSKREARYNDIYYYYHTEGEGKEQYLEFRPN